MYVTKFNQIISLNMEKHVSVHNLMVTEVRVADVYLTHGVSSIGCARNHVEI